MTEQLIVLAAHFIQDFPLITTANITMQFGAEPLFENISAQFGHGNRYGLIGANGCGKSTFMKILSGALTPTSGNVSITPGKKLGVLSSGSIRVRRVLSGRCCIMGDTSYREIKQERRIVIVILLARNWTARLETDLRHDEGY
eukprot:TRINITY_DN31677_c0_g1_i1.p1 TRINITY_DN31677_c0_g1~~TRINITY_DN31677_c0_g1_i1.p1  ORF type:complete len:165 (+),score=13.24 TRINITY_DN31677_c0_g1_i1:67-495(+)